MQKKWYVAVSACYALHASEIVFGSNNKTHFTRFEKHMWQETFQMGRVHVKAPT